MSRNTNPKRIISRGIITSDQRVLLAFNKKDEFFFLPGGHVEPDEACSDALLREIEEETTLTASSISSPSLISVFENVWNDSGIDVFELLICFEATIDPSVQIDSVVSDENHLSFHFLSAEDLKNASFQPPAMKPMVLDILSPNAKPKCYYKLEENKV